MKRFLKGSIVMAALILVTGCATPRVYPLTVAQSMKKEGVAYALPRTVIHVKVPIVKTTYNRGLLFLQAPTYKLALGLSDDDISAANKFEKKWSTYAIDTTALELSTFSEADPSQVYVVELANNPLQDLNTTVVLDDLGVITSASNQVVHREVDFAVSALKTIASIVSPLPPAGGEKGDNGVPPTQLELMAKEVYAVIKDIRQKRIQLIAGYNGPDALTPDMLKMMLNELQAQEDALLDLFTLTKEKTTWSAVFAIRPCGCTANCAAAENPCCNRCKPDNPVVFELLAYKKFTGVTDQGPELQSTLPKDFNDNVVPREKTDTEFRVSLQLAVDWNQQLSRQLAHLPQKSTARSFYYRVPAQATLRLMKNNDLLKQLAAPVAQLGQVCSLPVATMARNLRQDLEWSPAGGGLRKVSVNREGYSPETVEKAGAAVGQMTDPLARLQWENALIEAQQKNRELKLKPLTDAISTLKNSPPAEEE